MKLSKDLRVIYYIAIVCSIVMLFYRGVQLSPDSYTYISAWNDNLSYGHLDMLRTPIYPIFLGILKNLFGEQLFLYVAIILQYIVFLISVYYFYRICLYFINSEQVVFRITLFYSFSPLIIQYFNYILTETFAICGIIFLVYNTICFFKEWSLVSLIGFFFWLLLLVFLRPSFLYLLPIFLFFWGIAIIVRKRQILWAGLICTFIASICQLVYVYQFWHSYGVFTPSSVSVVNQYYIVRQNGLLYIDGITNEELKEDIKNCMKVEGVTSESHKHLWEETQYIIRNYSLQDIQQAIYVSYKVDPISILKKAGGRAYRACLSPLLYLPDFNTLSDIISVHINLLYLFIALYTFYFTYNSYRKKEFPLLSCLFYMLGLSNLIVAIVGAQGEWGRLILPSMPLYLLMFGQLCTMFKIKSPLSIEFK